MIAETKKNGGFGFGFVGPTCGEGWDFVLAFSEAGLN